MKKVCGKSEYCARNATSRHSATRNISLSKAVRHTLQPGDCSADKTRMPCEGRDLRVAIKNHFAVTDGQVLMALSRLYFAFKGDHFEIALVDGLGSNIAVLSTADSTVFAAWLKLNKRHIDGGKQYSSVALARRARGMAVAHFVHGVREIRRVIGEADCMHNLSITFGFIIDAPKTASVSLFFFRRMSNRIVAAGRIQFSFGLRWTRHCKKV